MLSGGGPTWLPVAWEVVVLSLWGTGRWGSEGAQAKGTACVCALGLPCSQVPVCSSGEFHDAGGAA